MYFPVGWPKQIGIPSQISTLQEYVVANRDRAIFAILTAETVSLWYSRPCLQITCLERSANSVSQFGSNQKAQWKPDSTMLAVVTTKGYIIFFKVEIDANAPNNQCLYAQKEDRRVIREGFNASMDSESVPAVKLSQMSYIQIPSGLSSLVCIRDELMVATISGSLQRIRWDGYVNGDMALSINSIPFSVDLQHTRALQLDVPGIYFTHIEYSPLLGGFAAVLSNGKAAFITSQSVKFEPKHIEGVWAQDLNDAAYVAVNHRYRLMAFGCSSGSAVVYNIDEMTGALQVSHRLAVSSKDYPDASQVTGCITCMRWTPDGCAIAVTWSKGGYSIWSVFGALLVCSLGDPHGSIDHEISAKQKKLLIKSMEWGAEGYHLWLIAEDATNEQSTQPVQHTKLLQIEFVKSALTVNPCMSNHEHLFLQGQDKLYINTGDTIVKSTGDNLAEGVSPTQEEPPSRGDRQSVLIGNKQWQIVPVPLTYLASNWPIRYTAIDRTGQCLAVAGKMGVAHYALFSKKWKLFGNETQERDVVVSGGLTWWRDFLCLACYNLLDQRDEIRFYPRGTKLDNTFSCVTKVPSQVLLLNTFRDMLIILCADCHIMLYSIERKASQPTPTVEMSKIQEVAIGNFIPHPAAVVAITLTSLRTESAPSRHTPETKEAESIILNVAGKLLMFQRDRSGHQILQREGVKHRPLPFCAPVMVASTVENMWSTSRSIANKSHLMEAMWLGCGAQGMKVWLPLFPRTEIKAHGFLSKRIMLPFHVDIYPLAVLFENVVILGAAHDMTLYQKTAARCNQPYLTLERTSHIYLHHVIRQLLRRNLGVHALEIASCCTELPYFPHVLELLLHEVLEEEATSKDPIPDPLLPRVVAFIQEFPEYLQTVVHCARKTEVALWHYLFTYAGSPKDLFEECLTTGQLDTAASYLIILQNLEKPLVSRQHATLLLDSALDSHKWELARDLVRFLKTIDPNEAAESPPLMSPITRAIYSPGGYITPPISPPVDEDMSAFPFASQSRKRAVSVTKNDYMKDKKDKKTSRSDILNIPKRPSSGSKEDTSQNAEEFFIDMILHRHARKQLSSHNLRDLGCFAANLEDYQFVAWLKKEKLRAGKVEDFVDALKSLHRDFNWPFPILSYDIFCQINKTSPVGMKSGPSSNLLDDDISSIMSDLEVVTVATPGRPLTLSTGGFRQRVPSDPNLVNSGEVYLKPQISRDDLSHTSLTEVSEQSSTLGDSDMTPEQGDWLDVISLNELEQRSQQLANKGPQQSEVELRYLLQVMLEAGCLEWSLLISLVLRDAMAVVRTVNTASLTETPLEIIARMREGLSFIELWADTECLGYKPFLQAIKVQSQQLAKLVETNPPSKFNSTKRLSISSQESGSNTDIDASSLRLSDSQSSLTPVKNLTQNEIEDVTLMEEESQCAVS
ncbi:unnamed protein product [Owenia fusiformis]|uniref:Protein RIC1 homolog n=1 Tax=Owenia fusiformis TaxID=6347 RepID=A0A8S4N492_OWEFU|nr:unnamed protein product [Owenia fusiformis]